MENSSQVIERNRERLPAGRLVIVNPEPDELFRRITSPDRTVSLSSASQAVFRKLQGIGADVRFEACPDSSQPPDAAILVVPREKERRDMLLHALSSSLAPASRLWLVGENRAGIKSSPKAVLRHFSRVEKLDSARHCTLFEASGAKAGSAFHLDEYQQQWTLDFAGKTLLLASLPGVFAHGRLDAGTALLLQTLQELAPAGKVLDFASGCGVVGLSVLALDPGADVTLLDDSALAIESGKRSLALNGLSASSLPSNGLAELSGRFDWIISNPPFHRGVRDDLGIAADFFRNAGTFLSEKGRILVVFNRHLPYAGWLRDQFKNVNCRAQNREFAVIEASKPR